MSQDMTGTSCVVCKRTKKKGDSIAMYRIPSCPTKRKEWIECLALDEVSLKDHHRVCSNHFPNGDQSQKPTLTLGQKFVSPRKHNTECGKRAMKRRNLFVVPASRKRKQTQMATPSGSDEQNSGSCTPRSRKRWFIYQVL